MHLALIFCSKYSGGHGFKAVRTRWRWLSVMFVAFPICYKVSVWWIMQILKITSAKVLDKKLANFALLMIWCHCWWLYALIYSSKVVNLILKFSNLAFWVLVKRGFNFSAGHDRRLPFSFVANVATSRCLLFVAGRSWMLWLTYWCCYRSVIT